MPGSRCWELHCLQRGSEQLTSHTLRCKNQCRWEKRYPPSWICSASLSDSYESTASNTSSIVQDRQFSARVLDSWCECYHLRRSGPGGRKKCSGCLVIPSLPHLEKWNLAHTQKALSLRGFYFGVQGIAAALNAQGRGTKSLFPGERHRNADFASQWASSDPWTDSPALPPDRKDLARSTKRSGSSNFKKSSLLLSPLEWCII